MTLELKLVNFTSEHQAAIRVVREAVFTDEQHVAPEIDFDGTDADAIHLVISDQGKPVATGRILEDGHIGRIAVLRAYRSQGLGVKIMEELITLARQRGYPRVFLGAQRQAQGFYSKLGFTPYGDEFMDAGIPHIAMEMLLNGE